MNIMSSSNVSGQVPATATNSDIHDFPSDVELASVLFPLPQQVHGKFMVDAETTGIFPLQETGYLLKMFVDHDQDLLKLNGQMNIIEGCTTDDNKPYAGGAKFIETKKFLRDRVYILQDKDDHQLAVVAVDGKDDYVNAGIVYSAIPLVNKTGEELDKEMEDMTIKDSDGKTFYPWFRVVDDIPAYTSVFYWDGVEFKPFIRAHPDKKKDAVGLLIKSASNHHTLGHLVKVKRDKKHGWDVTVAPGVDPAMMLCITAAMENLFGGVPKWEFTKHIFGKK